jgi:type I restriction enzyme S subunit
MLSARNIDKNLILFDEYRLIAEADFVREHARTRIAAGDVLLTIVGTIGRTAVVPSGLDGFTLQRSVAVLTPEGVLPKFLMYQLESPLTQKYFEENARGTAQKGVYLKTLAQMPIKVAPLAQQTRIVAEIEKQFSRLDEAVANLKRVKANLKRYKAAVLKAAVEGKLTEEWRRRGDACVARLAETDQGEACLAPTKPIETGAELLERILAERRKAVGKGKYKEPVGPDTSGLPELPAGWVWASLPQIGELNRGKSKHRPRDDARLFGGSYPFIQTGEVRKSEGTIREFHQTYSDFGLQQSRLWPAGTLCITIAANIAETGILTFAACFPDSVVGFLNENYPETTRYIEFFVRTAKENLERFAPATAQKNINLDVLKNVAVPFPPFAEQHQIVAEAERRLSIVAGAEVQVDANLRRAERMRQSILKQAFSGQLVPQNPNDEPASVLLERIRVNVSVGATHASPGVRTEKTKRARHASPLRKPKPLPMVAETIATYGDAIAARILTAMQPGGEYARADLAEPLGLTTGQWNAAIQELKRRGQVRQVGEKRGAKYLIGS